MTIDYDRLAEDLRDEVDSFAPARDTGRRDYDLDDVIDRFVSYASSRPGTALETLVREFGRQDPASAGQLRKLRGALRGVVARERKNPMKTKNPAGRWPVLLSNESGSYYLAENDGEEGLMLSKGWQEADRKSSVRIETKLGRLRSLDANGWASLVDSPFSEADLDGALAAQQANPVKPRRGESEREFISRCMSEEKLQFPKQKQRLAVCFSKARRNPLVPDDTNRKAASMSL